MDKSNPDENAASKFPNPVIKRKPLSKAAIERRRIKRLQRQFPTGDFSQTGSDPEPGRPNNLSTNAKAYILDELRRRLRSGKKAYGKHMTKDVMKIFGRLPNNEPGDLENWINWLCRNREELISGKYSPSKLNDASQDSEASSVVLDPGSSLTSASSAMHNQLSDLGDATEHLPITDEAPIPMGKNSLPGQNHDKMRNNLTEDEEVKRFEGGPTPAATQDRRSETLYEAPKELPNQVASHRPSDSAGQSNINIVNDGAILGGPKIPDKPDFFPQKKGAFKANSFFYKIHDNDSLEQIREKAVVLASDKAAVEEVLNRGPTERAYLMNAMRDLQVPLP